MKSALLLGVLILFLSFQIFAQKVFSVQYENQAGQNNGKWFFTKYPNQAQKRIFFVQYANQAEVKICFVKYENQAGWRNNSV